MKKCNECGADWFIQHNLSAYEGEVVLVCLECKNHYFNAQEFFTSEELMTLKEVK